MAPRRAGIDLRAVRVAVRARRGARRRRADPDVTPPIVATRVDAVYPPDALAARSAGTVGLQVVVDAEGHVSEATVDESGGAPIDEAAIIAVRQWTFVPAKRAGTPVASRIRVPFQFELPAPRRPSLCACACEAEPAASRASRAGADAAPCCRRRARRSRGWTAKRAPPPRARQRLRARPRRAHRRAAQPSAGDLLDTAPGVYVARPEGEAVAHEIFLRGFDAEHGQDIEFTVGGIPINQPSHIHGQGYADLNFIIPEVVRSIRVTEGVYDPRQGDFAVAGSVDFDLGVDERGFQLALQLRLVRHASASSPCGRRAGQAEETFGAAGVRRTRRLRPEPRRHVGQRHRPVRASAARRRHAASLHVAAYARARQHRRRAARATTSTPGASASTTPTPIRRASAQSAVHVARAARRRARAPRRAAARARSFGAWLLLVRLPRCARTSPAITQRSRIEPEWVGRGDLIEQQNDDLGSAAHAAYRTRTFRAARGLRAGTSSSALALRIDRIEQAQNLLQAPQNETWDRRVDADDPRRRHRRLRRPRLAPRASTCACAAACAPTSSSTTSTIGSATSSRRFQAQTHLVGFRRTAHRRRRRPARRPLEVTRSPWLRALRRLRRGLSLAAGAPARRGRERAVREGPLRRGRRARAPRGSATRSQLTAAGYRHLPRRRPRVRSRARAASSGSARPRARGLVGAAHRAARGRWADRRRSRSPTCTRRSTRRRPPTRRESDAAVRRRRSCCPTCRRVVVRADLGVDGELAELAGTPARAAASARASATSSPRPLALRPASPIRSSCSTRRPALALALVRARRRGLQPARRALRRQRVLVRVRLGHAARSPSLPPGAALRRRRAARGDAARSRLRL